MRKRLTSTKASVLSKMAGSEHQEQVNLFTWIRMFEVRNPKLKTIFAIPNGGYRTPLAAGKMKAEGQKSGVWDIFVACRGSVDGVKYDGMWMEMKFGRNKLSGNQCVFKETLQQYGASYNWVVCYCWTDAVKVIAEYTGMEDELWTKH